MTTGTNGAASTAETGGVDTRKWLKLCKYEAGVWNWVETFTNERALIEYIAGMESWALIEVNGRRRTVQEELRERDAMRKFAANAAAEGTAIPDQYGGTHLKVIDCMSQQGGGLVKALAAAWLKADGENHQRLWSVFSHYYRDYAARCAAEVGHG